ncbi:MAG TPA: efflux RND transporter periplasmic adaptor subunit [Candidatus Obscuribacterales bacterium]
MGLSGCALGQREAGGPGQAARADEIAAVDAAPATVGDGTSLTYTGTTAALQQVSLRSRVDGQVTQLTVDVGDAVASGEAIARLDTDLLAVDVNQAQAELRARQSEVAQARAAVSDAQTALESARVQLVQAQTEANRLSSLATQGAVAVQDAEQAQLAVDTGQQVLRSAEEQIRTRQEAVNAALGRVSAQQALVDQAQERLSYALVQSPLAGVVLTRLVEAGDYVQIGDEVLQIGDLSSIKVRVEVSDRDLAQVAVGQPVEVQLDAFPDEVVTGRVTRIAPTADPTSRLIPVEITIPNDTGRVGTGLLARVTFQGEGRDRVAIAQTALAVAATEAESTVFVVTDTNGEEATVQARPVQLGREIDTQVEVLSGLNPGETYVIRSSAPLNDGQTVRLSVLSETN